MTVLFINDKKKYNERYRGSLINYIEKQGVSVGSLGVFDDLFSFILFCFHVLGSKFIVSSNLKTNLLFLFFCFRQGAVILNGLGRYRGNVHFRRLLVLLIQINYKKKRFIVQNYADWRYLKRYLRRSDNVQWFPGSGGTCRKCVYSDSFFVVQRKDKFKNIVNSLVRFLSDEGIKKVIVVGCDKNDLCDLEQIVGLEVYAAGYVDQKDIFSFGGKNFIQPKGYGEGFPHTLADAIMSRLNIFIPSDLFVQLGLYKLGANFELCPSGWMKLVPSNQLISSISVDSANLYYYGIINKFI